jgi:dTDP-4-amino-4,6-dideoxygalactose transaminase
MTDMQAAMGIEQLKKLPLIIEKRKQEAAFFNRELAKIPHIRVPAVPAYAFHNYQSYWVEALCTSPVSRDVLMGKRLEKGIATRRGIMAIHLEECYDGNGVDLPATERITKNTILLPIYPSLTEEEQQVVAGCISDASDV